MKYMLAVTLMLSFAAAANAQVQHQKFTQNGAFANASGSTDPNSTFQVSVSRTSSGNTSSNTNVSFEFINVNLAALPDPTETFTLIIGPIPDADFTGDNTQSMALNLDTSTLDPTVTFSITCTLDLITFGETCTEPAAPGVITLSFSQNGVDRTQVLTLNEVVTTGPVTTRIHQSSDNASANVTGTIFGSTVGGATAT